MSREPDENNLSKRISGHLALHGEDPHIRAAWDGYVVGLTMADLITSETFGNLLSFVGKNLGADAAGLILRGLPDGSDEMERSDDTDEE